MWKDEKARKLTLLTGTVQDQKPRAQAALRWEGSREGAARVGREWRPRVLHSKTETKGRKGGGEGRLTGLLVR